ncbi:ABC transporter ATP-binding protein/permease [Candidatus Pelagibacter ubique]|nr:ABC transporter ATP-binding protein/permease [Candidatus Pelagibacter ubique]
MIKTIIEFFSLLTSSQRRRFYTLQILVIIMTFAEVASIFSITPFMAIVGDPSLLQKENLLGTLYIKSNLASPYEFIFYLGFIVLGILTISAFISIFITWRLAIFSTKIGVEIGDSLYSHYLNQDWLFHTRGSSSNLTKKISTDTARLTTEFILPLMYLNSRLCLTFIVVLILLIYDPFVLTICLIIFSGGYFFIFKIAQTKLEINNKNISNMFLERYKLMNSGFGGIKEVLLMGKSSNFIKLFTTAGNKLAYSQGVNKAIALVPRYFMELMGFTFMISLVLYLISKSQGVLFLASILPILSIYAIAGIKLLPALQQIFGAITTIKGNLSAYKSIEEDLKNINTQVKKKIEANKQVWSKHNEICLKNITFNFTEKKFFTINNVSLTIKPNTSVGFVGKSGSGKSTIIDIITGLIDPSQGEITIDGIPLNKKNLRTWQNKIGIVPQAIFLLEGSIAENVAFGISHDLIDYQQVKKVLKLAYLEEWLSGLENGIHTKVGERGIQLSGGQRQRIAIARSLYYEPDVLIFDEATSALDRITEKTIMNSIDDFSGKKTLIMISHRLTTVQKCDQIFIIDKGSIIDSGTYQELLKKNEQFKKM